MQIEIYNPSQGEPLPRVRWNYDELKLQLSAGLEKYRGMVYTADEINQAKKDRAALNKLAAAIDQRRREVKAMYFAPCEEFEAQAKELASMVKNQSMEIDSQVKSYEDARKAEKLEQVRVLYSNIFGDLEALVPFERIENPRWGNVTASMASIEAEITEKAESIKAALASIDALGLPDDMAGRVKSIYLERLDLAAALAEKEKIEREKAMMEAYERARKSHAELAKASNEPPALPEMEPPQDYTKQVRVIDFRVWASTEQLGALKAFLLDNGIKYGKVPQK